MQSVVKRQRIVSRMIIQNHQIKLEAFRSQVLLAAQELPGHRDVFFAIEAQDHNWQVAADSLRPETRL